MSSTVRKFVLEPKKSLFQEICSKEKKDEEDVIDFVEFKVLKVKFVLLSNEEGVCVCVCVNNYTYN